MRKQKFQTVGLLVAMSFTVAGPVAIAQETPPGGGVVITAPQAPAGASAPTQSGPSAFQQFLQNAIQQQQQIQQLNQFAFPSFINANPSVSPMDQRSGTTNNASAVNSTGTNQASASLGISSSKPSIDNSSSIGGTSSQPVNDPGKLTQLMVLAAKGQPTPLNLSDLNGMNGETLFGVLLNFAVANGAKLSADDVNKFRNALSQSGTSLEAFRDVFAQLVIGVVNGRISPDSINQFATAIAGQSQGSSAQALASQLTATAQKLREAQASSKPSGTSAASTSATATIALNTAIMNALAPILGGALGSGLTNSSLQNAASSATSTVQSVNQGTQSAVTSVNSSVSNVMSSLGLGLGSTSSASASAAKPSGQTITTISTTKPNTGTTGVQSSIGGVSSSGGISKPSTSLSTGYNLGQSSSSSSAATTSSSPSSAATAAPSKPPAAVTTTTSAITSVVNSNISAQVNAALSSVSSAMRVLFGKFP